MTVGSTYSPPAYIGDGSTRTFSFPYPYFSATDLMPLLVMSGTEGFVTPAPVLNGSGTYDYAVTGTADPTGTGEFVYGTVTLNTAPPSSMVLTIYRAVPAVQNTILTNNGPFPAKSLEAALDRVTIIDQQLAASDLAALRFPFGDPANAQLPGPSGRAGLLVSFDAQGNVVLVPPPAAAVFTTSSVPGSLAVGTQNGNFDTSGLMVGGAGAGQGGAGVRLFAGGHANWAVMQSDINYNPVELNLYGSAAEGQAVSVPGTNQVNAIWGSPFSSTWIGNFFYFNNNFYTVASVPSATSIILSPALYGGTLPFASPAVTATYHYCLTTVDGYCNTNGTTVTWVSGQPFIGFSSTLTINGVSYGIASINNTTMTLTSSAGVQTNVPFHEQDNIYDQISTLRIQKMLGANEEALTIAARAVGEYLFASLVNGTGYFYPLRFSTGWYNNGLQYLMTLHPGSTGLAGDGFVSLGGYENIEALRVLRINNAVNRAQIQGATTGNAPAITARGNDANVNMAYDSQGAASHVFTSHAFGHVEFQIFGNGGSGSLAIASDNAAPAITVFGPISNTYDLKLETQAGGLLWIPSQTTGGVLAPTGYLQVKDASGTVRKLLCV